MKAWLQNHQKKLLFLLGSVIIMAGCIVGAVQFGTAYSTTAEQLKQEEAVRQEQETAAENLRNSKVELEPLQEELSAQEAQTQQLNDDIAQQRQGLPDREEMAVQIATWKTPLEELEQALSPPLTIQYDTTFVKSVDDNDTANIFNNVISSIPLFGTSYQSVSDDVVKQQVYDPACLMQSYWVEVSDWYILVQQDLYSLLSQLRAMEEMLNQTEETVLLFSQYEAVSEQITALQNGEYYNQVSTIYNNLEGLRSSMEVLHTLLSLLMEPNSATESHLKSISTQIADLEACSELLATEVGVTITPETTARLKEQQAAWMEELLTLIDNMEGLMRLEASGFEFFPYEFAHEYYRSGRYLLWFHSKGDHLALVRISDVGQSSDHSISKLLYDSNGDPVIIQLGGDGVTIYLCQGEVIYSNVEDPQPYIDHAQKVADYYKTYKTGSDAEIKAAQKEFKSYFKSCPL